MSRNKAMIVPTTLALTAGAYAGPMEEAHFDIYVQMDGGRLVTGGADVEDSMFEAGVRVFEAEFGEEGTPNFIDEPGLFANDLPAGTQVGFTITEPLRVWSGGNFSTISPDTLTVHQAFGIPGSPAITTPLSFGERVNGFLAATADVNGVFDEHPEFELNAPSSDGIYLFTMTLWETDGTSQFGHSRPVHIVFGQNADHESVEIAAEFVEDNVANLPAPGAAGITALSVIAGVRRRR